MTRRLLAAGALLSVGTAGLLGLGTSASAHPLDLRTAGTDVQQVTVGGNSQLLPLSVERMVPGTTVTARFEVHRGSTLSGGTFAAQIADVEDFENGCVHPERAGGDGTCADGKDQGELSQQLAVGQAWSAPGPDCAAATPPSGESTMAAAEDRLSVATAATSEADTVCLVLVLDLPGTADNLVQSDSSRFALRIGLLDATRDGDLTGGGGTVTGPSLGGGDVSGLGQGALPQTGFELAIHVAVALLLIVAGGAALVAVRRSGQEEGLA